MKDISKRIETMERRVRELHQTATRTSYLAGQIEYALREMKKQIRRKARTEEKKAQSPVMCSAMNNDQIEFGHIPDNDKV